jgi:cytochrome c-type biogenesis protein CcmE
MMTLTKLHKKRLMFVMLGLLGFALAISLILYALRVQANYYYTPSQLVSGAAQPDSTIKAGGLVVKHSLVRHKDSLNISFKVTDLKQTINVLYSGMTPDLFREGTGVVVTGQWKNGVFMASQILAKHDENYMPPDVAATLKAK